MDVTCQRCKAEYEFDETLLGDRGTTVKCSSCGHVFRVLPPDREAGRAPLRLRFAREGRVEPIASLRELQQRIRAGEVGLDDELGRDGHPFRRLRDLPELKNFFARSPEKTTVRPDAAASAQAPNARPVARGNTILGNAPTVRPPPPEEDGGSGFGEMLEAPTVVAPIPEEIRPRAKRSTPEADEREASREQARSLPPPAGDLAARTAKADKDAKRTMLGVGPGALPALKTPSAAGTLGPPAAMARGTGLSSAPSSGAHEDEQREAAPKVSAAGTLIGPPAAAIAAREPSPPVRQGVPISREPRVPTSLGLPTAPVPPASYEPPAASYEPAADRVPARTSAAAEPRLAEPSNSEFPMAPGITVPAKTATRSGGAGPVQLYLEEDEAPMERVSQSSSKLWLYLLLFVGLGGGGWIGMNALRASRATDAVQPEAAVDAAVTAEATPDAAEALAPDGAAATAEVADAAAPQEQAKAPVPAAAKDESERDSRSRTRGEEGERERSSKSEAQSEPKDYGEWVARGDQLTAKNDYEGASKAYESALKLRPTGSEANAGLGFTLLQRGRAREALPHFDRAASSGYAEANVGLGDAYRKLGQTSSAVEAYKTYLDRLPSGSRASYARGMIDRLGRGVASDSPREPAALPPADTSYRPAGELTEPSAPAAPEAPAAAPSEPAPAAPPETTP